MVLNESPYGNRKDLLNEKITGISAKKIPEFLEKKGKEIEAKVRARYEFTSDGEFQAICAEQDANGFIRASYDGYGEFPIEVKYKGKEKLGFVPLHDWMQNQQQMAIACAPKILVLQSNDGVNVKEIWLEFNLDFWLKAEKELINFWVKVERGRGKLK